MLQLERSQWPPQYRAGWRLGLPSSCVDGAAGAPAGFGAIQALNRERQPSWPGGQAPWVSFQVGTSQGALPNQMGSVWPFPGMVSRPRTAVLTLQCASETLGGRSETNFWVSLPAFLSQEDQPRHKKLHLYIVPKWWLMQPVQGSPSENTALETT